MIRVGKNLLLTHWRSHEVILVSSIYVQLMAAFQSLKAGGEFTILRGDAYRFSLL